MEIVVLNVGTATIKAARYGVTQASVELLARHTLAREDFSTLSEGCLDALRRVQGEREAVRAIGHRIVHGGREFQRPTLIDAAAEKILEDLAAFAPLHNPDALVGLRAARQLAPNRPMIAVFDTTFHANRSDASMRYALPWSLGEELGLFRYGFHGIAHSSLVETLAAAENKHTTEIDAVTLQLGSGCSACAVSRGRSVETSMGFSPLEGLAMSTRVGDIDAGVVLHLIRQKGSVDDVERLLQRESGLLGLAGSSDIRVLLAEEAQGNARARAALELFVHRIILVVGAYWTLLGGRGALVFGGGVGTHSAEIRRRVVSGLSAAWGVELNESANQSASQLADQPTEASATTPTRGSAKDAAADGRISAPGSRPVYVFRTDEEKQIAKSVAQHLQATTKR